MASREGVNRRPSFAGAVADAIRRASLAPAHSRRAPPPPPRAHAHAHPQTSARAHPRAYPPPPGGAPPPAHAKPQQHPLATQWNGDRGRRLSFGKSVAGWNRALDEKGRQYYVHERTRRTSWVLPRPSQQPLLQPQLVQQRQQQAHAQAQPRPPPPPQPSCDTESARGHTTRHPAARPLPQPAARSMVRHLLAVPSTSHPSQHAHVMPAAGTQNRDENAQEAEPKPEQQEQEQVPKQEHKLDQDTNAEVDPKGGAPHLHTPKQT